MFLPKDNDEFNKEVDVILNNRLMVSPVKYLVDKYNMPRSTVCRQLKLRLNENVMGYVKRNRSRVILNAISENTPLTEFKISNSDYIRPFGMVFKEVTGVSYRDALVAQKHGVLNKFVENKGNLEEILYNEITHWINENYYLSDVVNKLKNKFNITESSLTQVWKTVDPDSSLREYLDYVKSNAARKLFLSTGWGIQAIAESCGFTRVQTLDQVHKRQYGITFKQFIVSKSLGFSFHYKGRKVTLLPDFKQEVENAVTTILSSLPSARSVKEEARLVNKNLTVNSLAETLQLKRNLVGLIINQLYGITAVHFVKNKQIEHLARNIKKRKDKPKCTMSILTGVP